jgi:branched-chain amino acid transport system substrate-binding protein
MSESEKKTSRRSFIKYGVGVVAAAAVAAGGFYAYEATRPPSLPAEIRIGGPLSLTGAMSAFGQGLNFGHLKAVEDINKLGGVNVGGHKLPIKYIAYDDTSDPTKAASLASQLILADKVDALVHGNGPPVTTNPICVTADRYKVPYLMGSPFESWWAGGPYKYSWSILFRIGAPIPSGDPRAGKPGYTITDIFFALTDKYRAQTNETVGLIAADDADGRGWYGVFPGALSDKGYKPIAGPPANIGLYPPGTTDFSSMIRQWIDNKCEILWGNLPGPDFGIAWRQCAEQGYRPKIAIAARAALFYEDVSAWGDNLPWGVGVEIWWDPTYPYKGIGDTTPASLAQRWYTETGKRLNRNIAFGYAAVQVLADAIERAGTLDKDAVNNAIASTDGMFMTGRIKFIPDSHDSPTALTYGQWVKTDNPWVWEQPIVLSFFPDLKPTHDPIFPLPPLT